MRRITHGDRRNLLNAAVRPPSSAKRQTSCSEEINQRLVGQFTNSEEVVTACNSGPATRWSRLGPVNSIIWFGGVARAREFHLMGAIIAQSLSRGGLERRHACAAFIHATAVTKGTAQPLFVISPAATAALCRITHGDQRKLLKAVDGGPLLSQKTDIMLFGNKPPKFLGWAVHEPLPG